MRRARVADRAVGGDLSHGVIDPAAPRAGLVNPAFQADRPGVALRQAGMVTAPWALPPLEPPRIAGWAVFVPVVDAPDFFDLFAAFVASLQGGRGRAHCLRPTGLAPQCGHHPHDFVALPRRARLAPRPAGSRVRPVGQQCGHSIKRGGEAAPPAAKPPPCQPGFQQCGFELPGIGRHR